MVTEADATGSRFVLEINGQEVFCKGANWIPADAILARGRAFGESRVVCNVHWHSDVVAGRFMGAATVARLHADPGFRAEIEDAKRELEAARRGGYTPPGDCQVETEALATDLFQKQ